MASISEGLQRCNVFPRLFFSEISTKCRIPNTDIFRRIKQCITKITGTAFLHFRVCRGQLAGLIDLQTRFGNS